MRMHTTRILGILALALLTATSAAAQPTTSAPPGTTTAVALTSSSLQRAARAAVQDPKGNMMQMLNAADQEPNMWRRGAFVLVGLGALFVGVGYEQNQSEKRDNPDCTSCRQDSENLMMAGGFMALSGGCLFIVAEVVEANVGLTATRRGGIGAVGRVRWGGR